MGVDRGGVPDLGRRRRPRTLAGLAVAVGVLVFASAAQAADSIYWTDSSVNKVSFAALDGSGGADLNTTGATSSNPLGVALDPAAGRIYWTNFLGNKISFARLDGTGGGGDLNTTGATVSKPAGPALDTAAGRIYWANLLANKISFARVDGTGGGGDLNTTPATVNNPAGVAVDPAGGRIYWANTGGTPAKIAFARLDGTGGGDLPTTGATVNVPVGVAVDAPAGRIYWANAGANKISFARLDGTGGGDLNTVGATTDQPEGVAIDAATGRVYWANTSLAGKISFARLDGTGGADLTTTGATLTTSSLPALLKAPASVTAPVVTGGSTPGSTLTCSSGTWAPDLAAAFLFRAPQSFSYRWTLDNTEIAGATANALQANAPGAYRCVVTATNQAGPTSRTSDPHAIPAPSVSTTTATATLLPVIATGPPSNRFTVGRLKGTSLTVTVEAPGLLTVGDATTGARTARKAKRKPRRPKALLKATQATGGPGIIVIKLALTRAAAKTLKKKHKLATKARITFTPTGGTAASTTAKLTVKTAKRKRRKR